MKRVVCICNIEDGFPVNLTIGKVYEFDWDVISGRSYYKVINDFGDTYWYDSSLFISLKEYRKMKLKKLNESRL